MSCKPVLFLVFNRPDTTRIVFEAIRAARPGQLFISADGPRLNKPGEEEQCRKVRAIAREVDWECEVKTFFRDTNAGGPTANSEGISWFFSHVEAGIILEDDCLPHPFFFNYCSELLDHYRNDERIMCIGGFNHGIGSVRATETYYFSAFPGLWGWASWSRAWAKFDWNSMNDDEAMLRGAIQHNFSGTRVLNYFSKYFRQKNWDFLWVYTIWKNKGICLTPNRNLVKNIGFGPDATHTTDREDAMNKVMITETRPDAQMVHPSTLKINRRNDLKIFNLAFDAPAISKIIIRLKTKLKSLIKKIFH